MKLTREIIKSAIAGETIQYKFKGGLWLDYINNIHRMDEILMDIATDTGEYYEYRVKPKCQTYRLYQVKRSSGEFTVSVLNSNDGVSENDVEKFPGFVCWIGTEKDLLESPSNDIYG